MNKSTIIEITANHIKEVFHSDSSGHDWWHIYRVWNMAKEISKREGGDLFVVEMAALLHDLDDHKFSKVTSDTRSLAENWMLQFPDEQKTAEHILSIVAEVSFKGANVKNSISTIEGMIVQDADRLDAIGAIGVARAFAYGGFKGHTMYDPDIAPQLHNTFEEYQGRNSSTINHFYEKLLLLKDRMNTKTSIEIAAQRHRFMESFLKQFFQEWNADDV